MGFDGIMHAIGMTLQVFFLDLILSGDNAVLIALACRRLPKRQMRQVILMGTGFAFFLRIVLTTIVSYLLSVPSLRLIGGLALMYIALKLLVDDEQHQNDDTLNDTDTEKNAAVTVWSTVGIVVVADLVMSIDNVIALAAVAQDNTAFLVFGLLLSVPLLMYGSLFVTGLLNRYPLLVPGVAGLLGWIAGDIAVADPLIAEWINTQSPGLTVVMPLLCAIFVLLQSRIVKEVREAWGINDQIAKNKTDISTRLLAMAETPVVSDLAQNAEKIVHHSVADEAPVATALSENLGHSVQASVSVNKVEASPISVHPPLAINETSLISHQITDGARADEESEVDNNEDEEDTSENENENENETESGDVIPEVSSILTRLRENGLLIGGLCLTGLLIFVFTHFGQSFIPAPAPMTQFDCPGYTGKFSLYYKHGGEKIQIRTGGRVMNGSVNYGKLQWDNTGEISKSIGFTLPEEIVSDSGRSVQINGGSFRQISCMRVD
ncbi:TerC family protein [Undibacterium sp. RuRC25W]|uniref:TerC family protein n=1 Tax=Undibacterium sp. RuRC25W TaxID=3413047 RepID=UPI003BF2FEDC